MTIPPRSEGSLVIVLGVVVLVLIGALAHSLLGIAHMFGLLVELGAAALIASVAFGLARFLSMRVGAPGWLWGVAFVVPTFAGSLGGGLLHDGMFGLVWLLAAIVGANHRR